MIFHGLTEAFEYLPINNRFDIEKFESLFKVISTMVRSVESSAVPEEQAAVKAFLSAVHDMIFDHKRESALLPTLVQMLDEVRKMPSSLLCSPSTWTTGTVIPINAMINLIFEPDLFPLFRADQAMLQHFLKKGCASRANALNFLESVTDQLFVITDFGKHDQDSLIALWKTVASSYKDFIDRHNEVSQVNSVIEHKLVACEKILSLPLKHFKSENNRGLWKQLMELLKQISNAAALINSYNSPEIENTLCQTLLEDLAEKNLDVAELSNISTVINSGILPSIPFKSLKSGIGSIQSILDLVALLINSLPDLKGESECASSANALCSIVATFLKSMSDQVLMRPLITSLFPNIAVFLRQDLLKGFGKGFEEGVDLMMDNAFNALTSRYNGAFDAQLLASIEPFIVASMSHTKRSFRSRAQHMWQLTFAGSLLESEIPPSVAQILKKSLVSSDSVSSSQDEDSTAYVNGKSQPNGPTAFGSFLSKSSTPSKSAETNGASSSPLSSKKDAKSNTPQRFKKPEPAKKKSLEDESSQDFVPITNSAGRKRRPLTEHQKDRMTSRRDDIPALYSELSRGDDSNLTIPPQFQSQMSMDDNSSQMALDEDAFKALSTKQCKNTKQIPKSSPDLSPVKQNGHGNPAESEDLTEAPNTLSAADPSSPAAPPLAGSSSSQKRKGRPPIKNLLPMSKRGSVVSSADAGEEMASPAGVKRKRAKPASKVIPDNGLQMSDEVATTHGDSEETSIVPPPKKRGRKAKRSPDVVGGSINEAQIRLNRLSPDNDNLAKCSPVKIIQEQPQLILEPAKAKAAKELSFDSEEIIIPSSQQPPQQQQPEDPKEKRGRKRRRESHCGPPTTATVVVGSGTSDLTLSDKVNSTASEGSSSSDASKIAPPSSSSSVVENKENEQSQKMQLKTPKNKYGETPLHTACKKGDLARVKILLEKGCDVNAKDNTGYTALHESMKDRPQTVAIVELLIEHGANVNIQADDGSTPLHDAVCFLPESVVRALLASGANPNIENKHGKTAFDIAQPKTVALLKGSKSSTGSVSPSKTDKVNPTPSPRKQLDRSPSPIKTKTAPATALKIKPPAPSEKATPEPIPETNTSVATSAKDVVPPKISLPSVKESPAVKTVLKAPVSETAEKADKKGDDRPALENGKNPNEDLPAPTPTVSTPTAALPPPGSIKSPLPNFSRINDKLNAASNKPRTNKPMISGRAAKILEMSRKKSGSSPGGDGGDAKTSSPNVATTPLMSPRVPPPASPAPAGSSNKPTGILTTPTSSRGTPGSRNPWEKFQPSPSTASPSAGILKKTKSMEGAKNKPTEAGGLPEASPISSGAPPSKRRMVQFTDPPVSDRVEIPRLASTKKRIFEVTEEKAAAMVATTASSLSQLAASEEDEEASTGLYQSTPTEHMAGPETAHIYPSLTESTESVNTILTSLSSSTWQKVAEKSLKESKVSTIGDLCKLSAAQAHSLKGLMPPDNVQTIVEAMKKFEKTMQKRENNRKTSAEPEVIKKKLSPVNDVSTPEEDDRAFKELFDNPSPPPEKVAGEGADGKDDISKAISSGSEFEKELGPPPPLIRLAGKTDEEEDAEEEKVPINVDDEDVQEYNIPTILTQYATPEAKKPASPAPGKRVSLRKGRSNSLQTDLPSSSSKSTTVISSAAAVASPKKSVATASSQATPEPEEKIKTVEQESQAAVATVDGQSMTDAKPESKVVGVQVEAESTASETQTEEISQDEVMSQALEKMSKKEILSAVLKTMSEDEVMSFILENSAGLGVVALSKVNEKVGTLLRSQLEASAGSSNKESDKK